MTNPFFDQNDRDKIAAQKLAVEALNSGSGEAVVAAIELLEEVGFKSEDPDSTYALLRMKRFELL